MNKPYVCTGVLFVEALLPLFSVITDVINSADKGTASQEIQASGNRLLAE
jgi:hypothetical protein